VTLLHADGTVADAVNPVHSAAALLLAGRILAVKALGGYQIIADPSNGETVASLRKRKERSGKPFALLALDVETVTRYALCDDREARLLESPGRPIVLLKARADNPLSAEVAPKSPSLGFMLPATPLQYLLLAASRDVLIATSGNAPDEPMARTNEEALRDLSGLVDGVLTRAQDHVSSPRARLRARSDPRAVPASARPGARRRAQEHDLRRARQRAVPEPAHR
jgi:hydrogenase maturation protein HypF